MLDYVPRLVAANLPHRVGVAGDLGRSRFWVPGRRVLDQGQEGACVGFGTSGEAAASPVRVGGITNNTALAVYKRAKEIDEWEGVDYDGTSVRAGMLVGRERGWWSGFRWALNMAELRAALDVGPVVVGVEWREAMYDAPDGLVRVAGPVVGGHCLLLTGYSAPRRAWRWRNSWGRTYGINGSAYIAHDDLAGLVFGSGGEAAVTVGRSGA